MDRTTAWDVTFRITFGLLIIGIGNTIGGFVASATGIFGLALYLLIAIPALIYGIFHIVRGVGVIVKSGTKSALTDLGLTAEAVATDSNATGRSGPENSDTDPAADD
ncbi:hypothetical protein E6P09_02035 [Haloferax mediterranei ATCC 33500]|nr:hypothetical protein [Haloferax mediterranei]AFK19628.1 hypothetical protein HFX_1932 [Haloferax mediterranei ATCC 33500]AHZ23017.1 hypothetical protein BM92_10380 [Haloferax mediterranei ATCC 33500]MDX5987632.1 hypothetical protein [Haloferax mediterranei ATCC 33500]QCQ74119.1 hypothetical protein E6P09_02035 [Haloferax mediterranei ATCC 33500]